MSKGELKITGLDFAEGFLHVALNDGRMLSLPLAWYPRLEKAADEERQQWRLLGDGEGVNWPDIDEDLSLEGFLRGSPAPSSEEYARRRQSNVVYVAVEEDLVQSFTDDRQLNDALREYLRTKKKPA